VTITAGFRAARWAPIWEWIGRDLLPTMTRDFNVLDERADRRLTKTTRPSKSPPSFQTKVVK